MRKIAFGLLGIFRRFSILMWKLRGKTEADLIAQRVVSGKSWDEFCDSLKATGAALNFPGAPHDAFNQAEGYRYLSRLARAGLMAFVEHADPRAPVIHRVAHETVKLGADNPDNYYQTAAIDGNYEYRITGRRNTIAYLSFGTQAGNYGEGRGLPPTGHIEAKDLEINEDGSFEILLSRERQTTNWLPMSPDTGMLIVRQTFMDKENETPAELHIERINCQPHEKRPEPFTPEQLDKGLQSVGTMVAGASLLFAKWARDFNRYCGQVVTQQPIAHVRS